MAVSWHCSRYGGEDQHRHSRRCFSLQEAHFFCSLTDLVSIESDKKRHPSRCLVSLRAPTFTPLRREPRKKHRDASPPSLGPAVPISFLGRLRAGPATRGAVVRASRQPNYSTPPFRLTVSPTGPAAGKHSCRAYKGRECPQRIYKGVVLLSHALFLVPKTLPFPRVWDSR